MRGANASTFGVRTVQIKLPSRERANGVWHASQYLPLPDLESTSAWFWNPPVVFTKSGWLMLSYSKVWRVYKPNWGITLRVCKQNWKNQCRVPSFAYNPVKLWSKKTSVNLTDAALEPCLNSHGANTSFDWWGHVPTSRGWGGENIVWLPGSRPRFKGLKCKIVCPLAIQARVDHEEKEVDVAVSDEAQIVLEVVTQQILQNLIIFNASILVNNTSPYLSILVQNSILQ